MRKGIDYIGVGTGALIFNEDGKVFLAKRGPKSRNEAGKWDFPGGSVDFGEKCEEAIKREIKEEFGFDIDILELLEVVDHIIQEEGQHWVSPAFIAKYKSGTPKILEPGKCSDIKWVDIESIDKDSLTSSSRENLITYLQRMNSK
ncbi:DNA mismatch repair protein MutT [Candidatus Woesearchaeota archaeon B3_Woes]|nr:MAG: DNA mismatch repair protein MutT [Candidatus Woesearchaeota archaeon B3_Woes]